MCIKLASVDIATQSQLCRLCQIKTLRVVSATARTDKKREVQPHLGLDLSVPLGRRSALIRAAYSSPTIAARASSASSTASTGVSTSMSRCL